MAEKTYSDEIKVSSFFALPNTESPTLKELEENSPGVAKVLLEKTIASYLSSVNVNKTMSPTQVSVMAEDIIDFYPNEPISMFKLFFKKARLGEVGETFGVIDEQTIMRWYKKFHDEALEYVSSLRKEPEYMKAIEPPFPDPVVEIPESLKRLLNKGVVNKQKEPDWTKEEKSLHDKYIVRFNSATTEEEQVAVMEEYMNEKAKLKENNQSIQVRGM